MSNYADIIENWQFLAWKKRDTDDKIDEFKLKPCYTTFKLKVSVRTHNKLPHKKRNCYFQILSTSKTKEQ